MKKLLAFSLIALSSAVASAGAAFIQYSIFSPGDLMLPWSRSAVRGLRIDAPYGCNRDGVYGLDVGVVGAISGTGAHVNMYGIEATCFNYVDTGTTAGIQLGALANRTKDLYGIQLASVANWNEDQAYGLQAALVNYDSDFDGLQFGLMNWLKGNVTAATFGLGNYTSNKFAGLECGVFNYGGIAVDGVQLGACNLVLQNSTGLQMGVLNASQHHVGLQLGLLNFNQTGIVPFFPIFNFNFNH